MNKHSFMITTEFVEADTMETMRRWVADRRFSALTEKEAREEAAEYWAKIYPSANFQIIQCEEEEPTND